MARKTAFTLIEIIVAMTIITLLASMLIVGIKYVSASTKSKATRVTLANAQAMLTELETTAGLSRLQIDYDNNTRLDEAAISAPALVSEGNPDRTGTTVQLTALVTGFLRGVPNNKKVMDQLPAEQLMKITVGSVDYVVMLDAWNNPILYVPAPVTIPRDGPDGISTNNPDPPAWADRYGLRGVAVDGVRDGSNNLIPHRVVNPGGIDRDDSPANWKLYPDEPTWGTPASVSAQITKLRHFRPFFVSAGPDGDFRTHDDNLYSFEN